MSITRFALIPLALAILAASASADDFAEINRQRAQRLFHSSRSPYKTYSGYTPGHVREYSTPTQTVVEWQAPAYLHERVTPRGYERYTGPSERVYSVVPRPVVVVPYSRPLPTPKQSDDDYYPPVP